MTTPLQHLQQHYDSMPPVAVMQLSIEGFAEHRLGLRAPLAPHVNDKGCAFGGSLASLMTLAGWGLVWLELDAAGMEADIYVADSTIRYLAPLYDELRVTAEAAADADWGAFATRLRERGRARIELVARVPLPDGRVATTFTGRYVAIARPLAAAGATG
nr:YiiD C-terminal domain-containing protein [Lysobacter sp. GX 14042]